MPAETIAAVAEPVQFGVQELAGKRRHRQAGLTIGADLTGKAINIAVRLLSIPLALQLLGAERYGLWLTVSSVLMWLNLSQLGLGGGLINEIGRASARDDRGTIQRHVSSAYVVLLGLAALIYAVILVLAHTPLAPLVLGVTRAPQLAGEAQTVFLAAGALFAISLLTNAIGPVCMGLQEGYLIYLSFAAGNVLSLGALLAVYWMHGSMVAFAMAVTAPTLLANVALAVFVYTRRHPDLRPRLSSVCRSSMKVLFSVGGALALVQLGELTTLQASSPLIANRLGLSEVPRYGVPFSIFMMAATVCQGLATAYQAAFCEASTRHDWGWIRSAFAKTRRRGLALIVGVAAAMALAGPFAIRVWTRNRVTPDHLLLAAMGLYFILMVVSMQNSVMMIALGHAGLKAKLQIFIAIVHIAGFLVLASRFGIVALPMAGAAGYAVDVLVSHAVIKRDTSVARGPVEACA